MKERGIWVQFSADSKKKKYFLQGTQTGPEMHPASYPVILGCICLEPNQLGSEADH